MNILHVVPFFLPHVGGVETHVLEVSKRLLAHGHGVQVLTVQHDVSLPLVEVRNGITMYRLPQTVQKNKLAMWKEVLRLSKHILKADVIQMHDVFWWLLPLYPHIASKLHITFHGWEGLYPVRWQAKLHRLIASKLSKTRVHVGSFIQSFYWDSPNSVVYGGVVVKPLSLPASQKKQTTLNLVFVGRLSKENEIEKYIKLLSRITSAGISYSMTWVGDGAFKPLSAKYGKVTGFITEYQKYLVGADLVFASSYLSILSAQERGKVVLGFYSNPLKKAYLETYPGSDAMLTAGGVEEMTKKLQSLSQKPKLLAELQKKARAFAVTQTWDNVTKKYESLWK